MGIVEMAEYFGHRARIRSDDGGVHVGTVVAFERVGFPCAPVDVVRIKDDAGHIRSLSIDWVEGIESAGCPQAAEGRMAEGTQWEALSPQFG